MKIEVHDDSRIAIELTKDDMSELDITYEDLDYSNIETRRVLWTVLDEASNTIGCDINLSERMLIEAVPSSTGGCIIYFTVLPKHHNNGSAKIIKRDESAIICDIPNVDDLFAACQMLKKKGYTQKSELFLKDKRYRLVLFPSLEEEQVFESSLCEYGDVLRRHKSQTLSHMREHWQQLATPDAVEKLNLAEEIH